jgi:hypothetical protein
MIVFLISELGSSRYKLLKPYLWYHVVDNDVEGGRPVVDVLIF